MAEVGVVRQWREGGSRDQQHVPPSRVPPRIVPRRPVLRLPRGAARALPPPPPIRHSHRRPPGPQALPWQWALTRASTTTALREETALRPDLARRAIVVAVGGGGVVLACAVRMPLSAVGGALLTPPESRGALQATRGEVTRAAQIKGDRDKIPSRAMLVRRRMDGAQHHCL